MRSIASVVIDRPIDEVFDYTNNQVADWSPTVVEDEVIEDRGGVGTTFRRVAGGTGRQVEFQGMITIWEPPYRSAVNMVGKSFDIDAEYRFDDLGNQTRVTQASEVTGKGIVKVMFALLGWLMKQQSSQVAQQELENLKRKLESGAAQIAD